MATVLRYALGGESITAQHLDSDGYLWIAHAQNALGNCILKKCRATNPSQTLYTINVPVGEIVAITENDSTIIFACDDPTYVGGGYSKINPLLSYSLMEKDYAWEESPIDVTWDGSYVFFLLPGLSGNTTKVQRYNLSAHQQTIILDRSGETVTNAVSIDYHNSYIWVVSETNPAYLVRIYLSGIYLYEINKMLGEV